MMFSSVRGERLAVWFTGQRIRYGSAGVNENTLFSFSLNSAT
jgi:hypothetical protein